MHGVFAEFARLLMMAAAAGVVSIWLGQPVLIAYITIGMVAGPAVLGAVVKGFNGSILGFQLYKRSPGSIGQASRTSLRPCERSSCAEKGFQQDAVQNILSNPRAGAAFDCF